MPIYVLAWSVLLAGLLQLVIQIAPLRSIKRLPTPKINFNNKGIKKFFVVIFPAIFAYYCWQKGIEIIGPNRATMFIQLMPLFSALRAIVIFKENFELFHFVGAAFIVSGIYLSNKKINA